MSLSLVRVSKGATQNNVGDMVGDKLKMRHAPCSDDTAGCGTGSKGSHAQAAEDDTACQREDRSHNTGSEVDSQKVSAADFIMDCKAEKKKN